MDIINMSNITKESRIKAYEELISELEAGISEKEKEIQELEVKWYKSYLIENYNEKYWENKADIHTQMVKDINKRNDDKIMEKIIEEKKTLMEMNTEAERQKEYYNKMTQAIG